MTLSVIIPIYHYDDHLDICLLSILGQVQMRDVQVVCVPVATATEFPSVVKTSDGINNTHGPEQLVAWTRRDDRVILVKESTNLYDALRYGITAAQGTYLLFMNQTDVITSVTNLMQAVTIAQQRDVQVLLTAKEQRVDFNALSPSERFLPNGHLLPKSIEGKVYSAADAGVNIFIMTPPVVYGNIYQQQYMAELFQFPHVFANAGDLAVSQIALLHAKRISHTDISTIRSRYEACIHPILNAQEISMTEETLVRQIMVKMATKNAEMIVQNILLFYLADLLAAYHPYSSFKHAAEHYMPLCQRLSEPITNDITQHLFGCLNYIRAIVHSDSDNLIETYTMPARGIVFREYIVRPMVGNKEQGLECKDNMEVNK